MDYRKTTAICITVLCIVQFIPLTTQATIGDGTISLYTGQLITINDTRGSCLVDGVLYPSETTIPRDHPCHYCICYQAQVSCYWKQCASPPIDCEVMEFENVCNPSLYVCEIPEKARVEPILEFGARLNGPRRKRKLWRRRISREIERKKRDAPYKSKLPFDEGFPVEFQRAWDTFVHKSNRYRRAIGSSEDGDILLLRDTSCTVLGVTYLLGEVIGVSSDICMECRCAAGNMFCSPKCCFIPSTFSISPEQWEGNSVFVRAQSRGFGRSPHPLYYVRNQYEKGTFI